VTDDRIALEREHDRAERLYDRAIELGHRLRVASRRLAEERERRYQAEAVIDAFRDGKGPGWLDPATVDVVVAAFDAALSRGRS
jgi:hypothetical protein